MCLWLLQFQLHYLGLHWVEVYGASYTSVGRIAVCACYFLPVACLVLVVNLPRVWHLAAAPSKLEGVEIAREWPGFLGIVVDHTASWFGAIH